MPDTLASLSAADNFVLTGRAGVPAELVDQARVDARAVGYAQGWSQGVREASENLAEAQTLAELERASRQAAHVQQLGAAVAAVQAAASRLDQTVLALSDEISDRILAAAVELAQALLGQELTDPRTRAAAVLSRVLQLAPDNEPVTIWLSPADHKTLTGVDGTGLLAGIEASTVSRLSFEVDPLLADGDATARSAATSIDARLSCAVQRLREYAG